MHQRFVAQICRWLGKKLPSLDFEDVPDPRSAQGRRWPLATLLRGTLVGLMSGCQSLSDVEILSDMLPSASRKLLGITRRIPDTTLRDALCRLGPHALRACLHRVVRAAWRSKSLSEVGLPFHVLAIDGKTTAIDGWDNVFGKYFAPECRPMGLLRTVTTALVSAPASPRTSNPGGWPIGPA